MRLITNLILKTRESDPVYRVRAVPVRTPGKLFVFGLPETGFSRTRGSGAVCYILSPLRNWDAARVFTGAT
jgi:hypothetical protein